MDHHLALRRGMDLPRVTVRRIARAAFWLRPRAARPFGGVKASSDQAPRLAYIVLAIALLPAAHALGQVVSSSDASTQELLREQERSRLLRQQQERSADVHLQQVAKTDSTRLRLDESPCFTIDRLLLVGDEAAEFQWALASADKAGNQTDRATGRCLGSAGISLVQRRIQNAILGRGFVTTRVLVEAQDLKTGTLKLTLIPGRVRNVKLLPGTAARATLFNAVPVRPGELLNLRDVEQGLENLKRPPTAQADIQILPADSADAKPGESDLGIRWEQSLPIRVSLSADDSGTRATGKLQGSITIAYDHLLTLNDLFYASFSHDLEDDSALHGTRGKTVHYSVPYGYWLLAASGSSSPYYQTVSGATQSYVYRGHSENASITLSRLIYRDATRKTTLSLGGWARASRNFIDDTEVEVQRRRMAGWEFGFAHRELMGAASFELRLNFRHGTGAMGAKRAPEEAFGEGTSRFSLILADGNLSAPFQLFGQTLRYGASWRMQSNSTPLIAQDRFSIGGRYTVRGFDGESSLVAERGLLVRNEVGAALGASGQEIYVGIDHGEVRGPATLALTGKRLSGAVVGLRGQIKTLQYDVFVGAPVRKPELFRTAGTTAGFSANVNF
jgi:hemolysin activation/secretion protein